jgi:hypothetical protein
LVITKNILSSNKSFKEQFFRLFLFFSPKFIKKAKINADQVRFKHYEKNSFFCSFFCFYLFICGAGSRADDAAGRGPARLAASLKTA